jgi:hypothetical protein
MDIAGGLVYFSSGAVLNPSTLSVLGTFPGVVTASTVKADIANNRVYFMAGDDLLAYNSESFALVSAIIVPGVEATPRNLTRWGSDGLAFTSGNSVFILRTSLLP